MPCYLPQVPDDDPYVPGICEGRDLIADEESGLRFASSCMRAEKAALKLIARAEQSSTGLFCKLEKRGHDRACIQLVLSRLQEIQLIDDRRFTRLWLESRIARAAHSPRRLLAGLRSRGIDRDHAESGIKAALTADAELSLLRRYVKKMQKRKSFTKAITKNNADTGRSLKYYLKGEGFSSQAIELFMEQEQAPT